MLFPRDDADHPLARSFKRFLQDPEFPCVGAKSALSRDQIKIVVARDITSGWDDLRIYSAADAPSTTLGSATFQLRFQAHPLRDQVI